MAERKLAGHTQRNIRSSNLHVVLSMFRSSDTLTIRDITERTGLSKTAVSKIVNELLSRGLVLRRPRAAESVLTCLSFPPKTPLPSLQHFFRS